MFTHLDQNSNPTMVDINHKKHSVRTATAQSKMKLSHVFSTYQNKNELILKKGPVFQTAIIAATLAVKKTSDLIPFCHPLPIEAINIDIVLSKDFEVTIKCQVKSFYKTGVEMEALTGASVAALTVYDMCKAIDPNISIEHTKLIEKTGGKNLKLSNPIKGLILTGGKSSRMGSPKALMDFHGKAQAHYLFDLLTPYCENVFLSSKLDQWKDTPLEHLPTLIDAPTVDGPLLSMIEAFKQDPNAYWIVVACDLPYFNENVLNSLLSNLDPTKMGVFFKNKIKGFPEALAGIYTPHALTELMKATSEGIFCPVKALKNGDIILMDQNELINLTNLNTPEDVKENVYVKN